MTTPRFNRGISDDFVKALNDEYRKGGWWRNLVDDPKTFLAIRDDYVNIYYRGCALLMLRLNGSRLEGSVDYKYLLRPDLQGANRSITVVDGKPDLGQHSSRFFLDDLANVNDLKRAVEPYAEEEKTGVHDIILGNPNVLDVEIAISDGGRALRIDMAALHKVDQGVEIRFYEAKTFSDKRLRAEERMPEVIDQINTYAGLLNAQRTAMEESYLQVCRNLSALDGVAGRHPERDELLKEIARESVQPRTNTEPYLIVFGFDADQRDGRYWKKHRDKLCKELGGRVKMVGRPDNLKLPR